MISSIRDSSLLMAVMVVVGLLARQSTASFFFLVVTKAACFHVFPIQGILHALLIVSGNAMTSPGPWIAMMDHKAILSAALVVLLSSCSSISSIDDPRNSLLLTYRFN
jgi:hypothetical protein